MPGYYTITWLPIACALTILLGLVAWFVWRARGPGPGLRLAAVAILPLALYLTGLLRLVWMMAFQVTAWASGFAFRASTWIGVALFVLAIVLFVGAGRLGSGRRTSRNAGTPQSGGPSARRSATSGDTLDPELDDINAILKRHGIE